MVDRSRLCKEANAAWLAWSLVWACLALGASKAVADDMAFADNISGFSTQKWGVDQGLPQVSVTALTQTQDGYLWLGTAGGLMRFDGVRFTAFDGSNSTDLYSLRIRSLWESGSGGLWIGTEAGGLSKYWNGIFSNVGPTQGLKGNFIYQLLEFPSDNLLVRTDQGLFKINGNSAAPFEIPKGEALGFVSCVMKETDDALLIGMASGLFTLRNGAIERHPLSRREDLPPVTALLRDRIGKLWVGCRQGLLISDGDQVQRLAQIKRNPIHVTMNIRQDSRGDVWVCTDAGLCRFRSGQTKWETFEDGHELAATHIEDILEDTEGNYWVATRYKGLFRLQPERIHVLMPPKPADENRSASWRSMVVVMEDSLGTLFFAGNCSGLTRYKDGGITSYTTREGLVNDTVIQIKEARDHSLWVGTLGGLSHFNQGKFVSWATRDGLPNNQTRAIYEDEDGTMKGRLTVRSSPGAGSTFRVQFPNVPLATPTQPSSEPDGLENKIVDGFE